MSPNWCWCSFSSALLLVPLSAYYKLPGDEARTLYTDKYSALQVLLTLLSWGWFFVFSHTSCSLRSWYRGRRRSSCSRACPGPQRCPHPWAQMCCLWTRRSERWAWTPIDFAPRTLSSILASQQTQRNVPCERTSNYYITVWNLRSNARQCL